MLRPINYFSENVYSANKCQFQQGDNHHIIINVSIYKHSVNFDINHT